ncbi:LysR family transcriptional regulator [Saccharopolyspora sp. NPDC050642]|uniref:LysR family transcriptional regulator n=1 Tax=Saccharopolyspora sp. NPDC050642 TaxID=3157099 RepID=UPI0033D5F6CE
MANDPTVQQLRVFQVLAEELHFGRAAQRLHLTQPPLTRHLQALEQTIGVRLLDRSSRRVELTAAGAAFAAELTGVLARLDRARDIARRAEQGQIGRLAIGYVEPLAIDLLPRVLRGLRQLHADLDLQLHELHTDEQVEALRTGTIDCGLLRAPANVDPELDFDPVGNDDLVAALPIAHRLDSPEIDLAELADEEFVIYRRDLGQGMITATLTGCAAAGFTPTVRHQAQSTPMLLTLVAAGEGVALVSGQLSRIPRPGVKFARLRGNPAKSTVMLTWRRGESSPVLLNLRHLLKNFGHDHADSGIDRSANRNGEASARS